MKNIKPEELLVKPVDLWANQWLLLTAGTKDDYNMMTVAWGSIGCMWAKPFVQIVVRPQRHTFGFIEKHNTFTLCAFDEKHRADLSTLGSISGRDCDKIAKTVLTPKPSTVVSAPAYEEANLILECKKLYFQDFDPAGFMDDSPVNAYPDKDYHRAYFGEIVAAFSE